MSKLNREQRTDIHQYAQQLVNEGLSRRQMDTVLREYSFNKYGISQSVGKATHTKLFRQKVLTATEHRLPARPTIQPIVQPIIQPERQTYTRPRKRQQRKQAQYDTLIKQHFLPKEARILLSRLVKLDTNELQGMIAQRKALYDKFVNKANEHGYSPYQFQVKWQETVKQFYIDNRGKWIKDWLTFHRNRNDNISREPKMGFNAIWDWYGYIKEKLPPDAQSDTPRRHKRKAQKPPTTDEFRFARQQKKQEKIKNLQAQLKTASSPAIRKWLRDLITKEKNRR